MNILFVCKHNRFRSKMAEAIFNKLNKNKNVKVESAGIIKDIPVSRNVRKVMREKKIKLKSVKSRRFTRSMIEKAGLIVIVADNVDKRIFKNFNKKIIIWKISDVSQDNIRGIRTRVNLIEKKVVGLNRRLGRNF